MAFDAHIIDQMSEEEILARLVADPRPLVPSKKAKLGDSQQQQTQRHTQQDPLDRYLRENRELQQISLRLEQENDSLAYRLVTSKIALRNALDQAEDQADELTRELSKTGQLLLETQEEKRGKEEEVAMLKEVFRRELEKAKLEVTRSTGIITDYKQICFRLTSQLEKQQSDHREELETLRAAVLACSSCRQLLNPGRRPRTSSNTSGTDPPAEPSGTVEPDQDSTDTGELDQERGQKQNQEKESLRAQVRELEQELAQTKLQLVESKCRIQELEHQRGVLAGDLQSAKNNWFNKTLTTLRTASGTLQGAGAPRDGDLPVGSTFLKGSLSAWSSRRSLKASKESREKL